MSLTLFELDTNILEIRWFLTDTGISSLRVLKAGIARPVARWEWESVLPCPFVLPAGLPLCCEMA